MHQHIITYRPTYLLLKSYINAGKVSKTFWELISYHLYSNESGRNYCFSYNTGKKMEALYVSSFFKVSTDNKWLEPSGLNPGSPTPEPVFGHPRAALNSSSLTLPTSLLFPLSYFHWISPACSSSSWAVSSHLLATKEGSVRANPPLSFSNYCPCIQTFSCKAILI